MRSPLDAFVAACRERRPELADAFARALGEAVAGGLALQDADVGEIWLAVACAAGQRDAMELFDRIYLQPLRAQLSHMRLDDAMLADVLQTTRRRLLISRDGARPRLVGYAGTGQLAALVRVVATRAALDARRDDGRKREVGLSDLTDMLLASADPERMAASARKRDVFRAAFEAVVAALPAADRTLMRLYAVDGVGIDGLAKAYGVHRSTAARRLASVRERIRVATHAELANRGVSSSEIESIIAVVDDGLELTLSRILAEPHEPTDPAGRDADA